MEKGFDLRRFGLMVRWDLTTNWKSSVRTTLYMALGLLLMYEFDLLARFNGMWDEVSPVTYHLWLRDASFSTNIAFVIFMIAVASFIFVSMKTRQQRTAFLMMPASPVEKFLERLLYVTVGGVVMFFAASVIADVLRLVISLIFGPRIFGSVVITGMGELCDVVKAMLIGWNERTGDFWLHTRDRTEGLWNLATFASFTLFIHSLYVLGGSLFRRNGYLLTTFFIIAAGLMLGWLDIHTNVVSIVLADSMDVATNRIYPFIFGALAALCYWGSYRIYLRMQIINNKWTNL